jgi:hypothetical protein
MKFSTLAVLAIVAPVAAFVPAGRPNAVALTSLQKSKGGYDFGDLDKLSFPTPEPEPEPAPAPTKAKKAKKVKEPEPVPAPAPAPEPVKAKKAKKVKAPEPAPAPAPVPEPAPAPKAKKAKKAAPAPAPTPDPIAAKIESLKSKAAAPAPVKPAPKPKAEADSSALPLGVALGGAPLIVAPLLALSAGREVLAKTQARRAKIQEEIAEFEAAQAKKKYDAQVDGSGITKALVSKFETVGLFFHGRIPHH